MLHASVVLPLFSALKLKVIKKNEKRRGKEKKVKKKMSMKLATTGRDMPKATEDVNKICMFYHNNDYSKGYFMGDDPFDYAFPSCLFQLIIAFVISRVIYFVLKPLKQPKFISHVLSGITLGPSVLGRDTERQDKFFPAKDKMLLGTLASIGGIYFIFLVSVKMDKDRIVKMAKINWNIAATCYVVSFTITLSLTYWLDSYIPGMTGRSFIFFFSSVTSLSLFPVIAHAITELNLLTSELGQLAMSVAIFNEMVGWFNLALIPALKDERTHALSTVLSFLALLSITFFVLRPAVMWIVKTTPEGKPVEEIYIVAILVGALIMGNFTNIMGISYWPGALIMGLIIPAGPPLGSALIERCELVISNFFIPFFFIRIGQHTDVFSIKNWTEFAALELIIIGSYIGKLVGSLMSLIFIKMTIKNALLFGCILNLKGIMDLIIILGWRVRKLVDKQCFTILVLSHLAMTAILTPLVSICYKPQKTLEETTSRDNRMRTLATTPLDSELLILCCIHYEESVHGIITLLKAFNPTDISPICAYVVNLVELVGRAAPLLVPYNTQKRKLRANSTDRIMRAITKFSKTSTVPVSIQLFTLIAPYKTMHESISKLARDKFIPFLIIPFHQTDEIHGRKASLHTFNINMQAYSPCTIGIFVDRGLPRYLSSNYFSYNVALFFLGGPDDREAMALASRMSGHSDINITLFRIDVTENDQVKDGGERFLDDNALNEFKKKNLGNASFVCHEIVAKNTLEVMETIRSAENDYDLVIVGKRRRANSQLEKEMEPWADYQELGVIGDMLASTDFCGGMIPVLVIQCVGRVNSSIISDIMSPSVDRNRFSFGSTSSRWDNKKLLGSRKRETSATDDRSRFSFAPTSSRRWDI